jgi:CRP/FNR family transcriptional regulator, polysaccharide utilization system transcription regulator
MTTIESMHQLIQNHWFSNALKPDELNLLLQKSAIVSYRKRETIIKRGEFANHLVLLIDGFVKVENDESKKNFILDIVQGGNFIGLPLVLSMDKYEFSVVSLTDSQVLFIPVDVLKKILLSNSKLCMAIINYGNESFVSPLLDKLKSASRNNIRGRLAKLILLLAQETHKSNSFALLISRFEMAQMIGFSRENVIRMLTEFHAEGIIKLSGKTMHVYNIEKLEEMALNS